MIYPRSTTDIQGTSDPEPEPRLNRNQLKRAIDIEEAKDDRWVIFFREAAKALSALAVKIALEYERAFLGFYRGNLLFRAAKAEEAEAALEHEIITLKEVSQELIIGLIYKALDELPHESLIHQVSRETIKSFVEENF